MDEDKCVNCWFRWTDFIGNGDVCHNRDSDMYGVEMKDYESCPWFFPKGFSGVPPNFNE